MNNPRINLRLLRQALGDQFNEVRFRNGEIDRFNSSFQELTGSQKHSYIILGDKLAEIELRIRIESTPPTFAIIPIAVISAFLKLDHCQQCLNCDTPATMVIMHANGTHYGVCNDHITIADE